MSDKIDIFGADKALLIKVRNVPEIAASQGMVASFAQKALPETVEDAVYSEIAKQLKDKLREQKVDTDISIIKAPGGRPDAAPGEAARNVAIGLGVVGIGLAAFYAVKR